MLSIPKYREQYAQHFPTIFYLLCCASQHHVRACTPDGGRQPCSAFPRAWRCQAPRSTRPSAGGIARRPRSGGPASIGGRARSPPWSPPYWRPSGTWDHSPSAALEPPPRRPGPVLPSAGCSWSRGGTTRRRAPGPLGGCHPQWHRQVPPPGRQVPRRAPGPASGRRRGVGLHPAGVRRVLRGDARPRVAPATPAAPVPRVGDDAHARAWLAARALVEAWRQRRRVQVMFHAP